jgi:hypothetical protein
MPMIDVYATEGTFADKHALAQNLAAAVMRWERVPDLALFRDNTASFVHDLAADSIANVAGESNYVRVQVLTPAGVLDREWFTADQPSKQFASFAVPGITEVGIELDHKLAALLDALEVPVPSELEE